MVKRQRSEERTPSEASSTLDDHHDEERQRLERACLCSQPPKLVFSGRGSGVGCLQLSDHDHGALVALHDTITSQVKQGVTWGEGQASDPRRRCYAFLPDQLKRLGPLGISIQSPSGGPEEHHKTIRDSCLEIVWDETKEAATSTNNKTLLVSLQTRQILQDLTHRIRDLVPEAYRKFVCLDQLVAVQPNHHKGASYLPLHLDFPRADGFGVVIATVGIRHYQKSQIVLVDEGDQGEPELSWSWRMKDREVYILAGEARNKCLHGVLVQQDGGQGVFRETLNLRYGLHTPEYAYQEVDQHWPDS